MVIRVRGRIASGLLMVLILLFLIISVFLIGCSQEEQKATPTPIPTPSPTPLPYEKPKLSLVEITPSKEQLKISDQLLPKTYTWKLFKGNERSDMYYPSFIPRKPEIGFKINVKPNFGGTLATPVVSGNLVLISDTKYLYAYDRNKGELLWKWVKKDADIKAYGAGWNVYVATLKTYSGGRYDLLITSLDAMGNRVWESKVISSHANFPTSNLLVAEGKIFVGTVDGMIYAFSEGGELLWEVNIGGIVRGLAYGDGMVFANSEGISRIFAIDSATGKIAWEKEFTGEISTPLYSNGKVLFISGSKLTCISSSGDLIWQKSVGTGSDVNTNSFISAKSGIVYSARTVGDRPLSLNALNFDGKKVSEFRVEDDEYPAIPLATEEMVILPVTKYNEYSKIYLIWRGVNKIYELKVESEETFAPKISVDKGEIFVVFSLNRTDGVLYKLQDKNKPVIKDVKVELKNESVIITSTIYDSQSSIFKPLLFYSINNSEWSMEEMTVVRRYIMEPIGGYGFKEEPYNAKINLGVNSTIEFFIVGIDKVGNYVASKNYAYKIVDVED